MECSISYAFSFFHLGSFFIGFNMRHLVRFLNHKIESFYHIMIKIKKRQIDDNLALFYFK